MFTPPAFATLDAAIHRSRSDALERCLIEYRHALELLSLSTPAGAEALRAYLSDAVRAMEEELRSRHVEVTWED